MPPGNSEKNLRDYIEEELKEETSIEEIRESLVSAGWDEEKVDKALNELGQEKDDESGKSSPISSGLEEKLRLTLLVLVIIVLFLLLVGIIYAFIGAEPEMFF